MGAPSRSPSPNARSVAPDEIFFLFRPFLLFFDWLCENLIWYFYLRNFQVGSFQVTFPNGVTEIYGDADNEDFRAVLTVHSRAGFRRMVLGESVGLAEGRRAWAERRLVVLRLSV